MSESPRLPPSPPRFWHFRQFQQDPLKFMVDLLQIYGDVARWRGVTDVYFVNHPDHVRKVLSQSYEHYSKSVIDYRVLAQIMGNGLVTNDGPHWVKQRKLMQPMFANRIVNGFDADINRLTENMLNEWRAKDLTQPIWIDREMGRLTFQIVGATLFGSDIDAYAEEIASILDVVNLQTQEIKALMTLVPWFPTSYNHKWRRAKKRLDEIVYAMIDRRRRDGAQQHDILDRLLAARDEDTHKGMSETQMRDEVVTLMLAGHETSATALGWTLYLLSQHPEIEARLVEELTSALQGRSATSADLASIPYLKQVVQESMRIYPPVWAIARRSQHAETFGAFTVPSGAYIGVVPYTLHRHPEFWSDPDSFEPERFQPHSGESRHSYSYLPFAAGPRACIGLGMAMLEIQLVLAQILQRYRMKPVPGHTVEPLPKVTLKQAHGLPMVLSAR